MLQTHVNNNLFVKTAYVSICVERAYLHTCVHIRFRYKLKNYDPR